MITKRTTWLALTTVAAFGFATGNASFASDVNAAVADCRQEAGHPFAMADMAEKQSGSDVPSGKWTSDIDIEPAMLACLTALNALEEGSELHAEMMAWRSRIHYGVEDWDGVRKSTKIASANGNAYASYNLGLVSRNGLGQAVDGAKAVEYFKQAAEGRHQSAYGALTVSFRDGLGIEKDPAKARKYAELGALQDHHFSQFDSIVFTAYGRGGPADFEKSALWIVAYISNPGLPEDNDLDATKILVDDNSEEELAVRAAVVKLLQDNALLPGDHDGVIDGRIDKAAMALRTSGKLDGLFEKLAASLK